MNRKIKENITIPNAITLLRIFLIPVFVYFYVTRQFALALIFLGTSGLSDVADGFIARKFNMISPAGKIFDPIADKMTSAAVALCLGFNHPILYVLAGIFTFKEILSLIGTIILFRKKKRPSSARWWGKMATAILYCDMLLAILSDLYPNIIKEPVIITVTIIAIICTVFAFSNYLKLFFDILKSDDESTGETV